MMHTTELREIGAWADNPAIIQAADEIERLSALADKWNLECDELREDNKRLAAERDQYMETSLWQAKRISELMDEQAALAAQEHPALQKGTQIVRTLDARPAVPLNDAGLLAILKSVDPETRRLPPGFKAFARAVEAAHGIKPVSARDHKPNEPELFGWMVSGVPTVMRGSLAEAIQKNEAKRIGGTCVAFPVYAHPDRIAAANRQAEATDWSAA